MYTDDMPGGKKILIIEPDSGLNGLICDALRDASYDPVPCAPEQAVALAVELSASAIIAALSSSALESSPLCRALRLDPRTKAIALVVITGRGDTTIRRRLGDKPAHVLFKPFELEALVQTVALALGGA